MTIFIMQCFPPSHYLLPASTKYRVPMCIEECKKKKNCGRE